MSAEEQGMCDAVCTLWTRLSSSLCDGQKLMAIPPVAQMRTSVPIARAMLKDIKPPISDDAIADSLWHYWFDVEKAVGWLRKDWEKKG
jgi:hypothetical protein